MLLLVDEAQEPRMSEFTAVLVGTEHEKNGKFSVSIDMICVTPEGEELHIAGTVTSAAVFDTGCEALDGGFRAVDAFTATGKFPNMCVPF
jgi:hypothetical protein